MITINKKPTGYVFNDFMNHRIFLTIDQLNAAGTYEAVARTSGVEPSFYFLAKSYYDTITAALAGAEVELPYTEKFAEMTDDYISQNIFKILDYMKGRPQVEQHLSDVIANGRDSGYLTIKIVNTKKYSVDGVEAQPQVLGYLMIKEQFEALQEAFNDL